MIHRGSNNGIKSECGLIGLARVADSCEWVRECLHPIAQGMEVAPCDPSTVARCAVRDVGLALVQLRGLNTKYNTSLKISESSSLIEP